MSGRMRRITLANGEEWDVPEENALDAMKALDKAGLHFLSDGMAPSGDTSAPPSPTAPDPSGATLGPPEGAGEGLPADDRSIWQRFVDTVRQAPLPGKMAADPGTQALAGGFAHGISAGAAGAIPGEVGQGMRDMFAGARAGAPQLYDATDAIGSMAMPLGGTARTGVLANAGQQALEGGVQGAVRAYSDSNQDDEGARALSALAQGGKDAGIAGTITGALGAAAKGTHILTGKLREQALERMANAENTINSLPSPPSVDVNPLSSDLRSKAAAVAGNVDPAGQSEAAFRTGFADQLDAAAPNGAMPFDQALANRRYIDQQIDWNRRGGVSEAPMQEAVRREMANGLRGGISQSLDNSVAAGQLDPALAKDWKSARDDYALGAAGQEFGQKYLPSALLGAAGVPLGGYGMTGGAVAGQFLRNSPTAQRAISGTLNTAVAPADWISKNAPIGGLTAALGGNNSDAPTDSGEQALSNMAAEQAKIQGEARGYLLPQAVKQAVQNGQLGPYNQVFASLTDDADITATIQRLRANDPQFARQYLPMLNQMTAER